jgi:regulator of protease activity HflC (stomatin/prohibitin superfamily)
MKIAKSKIDQIIKEETAKLLKEAYDMPDASEWDREPSPMHSTIDTSNIGQQPIRSDMHAAAERLMDIYHDDGIEVVDQEYLEVHYPSGDIETYRNEDDAEQDIELRQKEGRL